MDRTQPEESTGGMVINFHAPCETQIVHGDHIEVNVVFNDSAKREPSEIRELVASALDAAQRREQN